MARGIGNFFKDAVETIRSAFVAFPLWLWGKFKDALQFARDFASGFAEIFTKAIDAVIEKFQQLIDKAADAIEETAEFLGLDVDDDVADALRQREQTAKDAARSIIAGLEGGRRRGILEQVRKEFGGVIDTTRVGGVNLTGARTGAAERTRELFQNIDAPITVNVDAQGQTSPAAIARKTATEISRANNARQTGQTFQTSGG